MGLLDKIRQRRETEEKIQPTGKPVTARTEEEFIETCRSLTTEFKGIMFLSGEIDGERYSASIIIEKGLIVGSTFEFSGLITFREQSIEEMKTKLKGSRGTIYIYELEDKDMLHLRESNASAFNNNPIPLSSLGLKLILFSEETEESISEQRKPIKVPDLFRTTGNFNLLELARKPEALKSMPPKDITMPAVKEEELRFSKPEEEASSIKVPSLGDRKAEELRRIKEERQKKMAEWLAKSRKREEQMVSEEAVKPVQTTIDKLYSLVKKYQRLKIDDKLAHTLGVSRAQIEEWAVILEEHDLIELHYPTIGEPEIRIKE